MLFPPFVNEVNIILLQTQRTYIIFITQLQKLLLHYYNTKSIYIYAYDNIQRVTREVFSGN